MLYKYLPPERIDVLRKRRIRFSQPSSLNDPYERMLLVENDSLNHALKIKSVLELDSMWAALSREEKSRTNRRIFNKAKAETIHQIDMRVNAKTLGDEAMKHIDRAFGILSLSRVCHSLLMWSHYASSFTGFVVEFDARHDFFRGTTPSGNQAKPLRVSYSSRRTVVSTDDPDYYSKLLCEKPLEWAYEEEERILRHFTDDAASMGIDSAKNPIYLESFPPDLITAVMIGFRAPKKFKNSILKIRDRIYPHAEVLEAFPSIEEYRVEFAPL